MIDNSLWTKEEKKRARLRLNAEVAAGRIPRAKTLPCFDCGERWRPDWFRHEYDHYLGYDFENALNVQCVCAHCHRRRTYGQAVKSYAEEQREEAEALAAAMLRPDDEDINEWEWVFEEDTYMVCKVAHDADIPIKEWIRECAVSESKRVVNIKKGKV